MRRELNTHECYGTKIVGKRDCYDRNIMEIVGDYDDGFVVLDNGIEMKLPFTQIEQYDVIEESPMLYFNVE